MAIVIFFWRVPFWTRFSERGHFNFSGIKKMLTQTHVYRDLSIGSAVRIHFPLPPSTILSYKSLRLRAVCLCDAWNHPLSMLRIIAFQRGHCMWQHDQHRNNIIKFPWIRDILTVLVQYNTVDSHSLPRTEDAHQMHDTTVVGYVFLLNSSTWNHESLF